MQIVCETRVNNLLINFGGTKEFLENTRRGLFSYDALRTRLETNKFESTSIRDFSQPVIKLFPLSHEDIFVLLKNLKAIFEVHYNTTMSLTETDIQTFMEEVFNRPGANEFLTPRDVIRDFLKIMSILRQNPQINKYEIIKTTNEGDSKTDIQKESLIELI